MNNLSGGYIMVDLSSPNKVKQLEKAVALNKPLLVYYTDGTTEWGKVSVTYETVDDVDIPTYHITTANGFVTVEADGDVSIRPTFVEGEGVTSEITGVTFTYNKWSLSGTHLMIVLCGDVADTTVLTTQDWCLYDFPDYIKNKIVVSFGAKAIIIKAELIYASDFSNQSIQWRLQKNDDGKIAINVYQFTATKDRKFRIQFDLLIDNE